MWQVIFETFRCKLMLSSKRISIFSECCSCVCKHLGQLTSLVNKPVYFYECKVNVSSCNFNIFVLCTVHLLRLFVRTAFLILIILFSFHPHAIM